MKTISIVIAFVFALLEIPILLNLHIVHATEISDSGSGYSTSKRPKPTSTYTDSFQKSEDNLNEIFYNIFNFDSVTPIPSNNNPTGNLQITQNPTAYPSYGASPITPITSNTSAKQFEAQAKYCLQNKEVYLRASAETGVPPEILAGLHSIEGSCNPNQSLVAGKVIGAAEPDIKKCKSDTGGALGEPRATAKGCVFDSLLDTAVYAGRHLIGKIGKVPTTFEEYVGALSDYNGGGNRNCGRTPYTYCPPKCYRCDDIYPLAFYDDEHVDMYLVYCWDGEPCPTPEKYTRAGVLTIAGLYKGL